MRRRQCCCAAPDRLWVVCAWPWRMRMPCSIQAEVCVYVVVGVGGVACMHIAERGPMSISMMLLNATPPVCPR